MIIKVARDDDLKSEDNVVEEATEEVCSDSCVAIYNKNTSVVDCDASRGLVMNNDAGESKNVVCSDSKSKFVCEQLFEGECTVYQKIRTCIKVDMIDVVCFGGSTEDVLRRTQRKKNVRNVTDNLAIRRRKISKKDKVICRDLEYVVEFPMDELEDAHRE